MSMVASAMAPIRRIGQNTKSHLSNALDDKNLVTIQADRVPG